MLKFTIFTVAIAAALGQFDGKFNQPNFPKQQDTKGYQPQEWNKNPQEWNKNPQDWNKKPNQNQHQPQEWNKNTHKPTPKKNHTTVGYHKVSQNDIDVWKMCVETLKNKNDMMKYAKLKYPTEVRHSGLEDNFVFADGSHVTVNRRTFAVMSHIIRNTNTNNHNTNSHNTNSHNTNNQHCVSYCSKIVQIFEKQNKGKNEYVSRVCAKEACSECDFCKKGKTNYVTKKPSEEFCRGSPTQLCKMKCKPIKCKTGQCIMRVGGCCGMRCVNDEQNNHNWMRRTTRGVKNPFMLDGQGGQPKYTPVDMPANIGSEPGSSGGYPRKG